ncbi:MAG: transposase [Antarcticimicrobium sp.]|uniref:transposase n=1 Tax=Antarcticimicrobium sp. TaxID=2824147 RepID=UPI0026173513|nr:transposase [Antarcticimicrobium sp.]MDF1716871.1 transposase [Antarcticimicrobium sp.]
MLDGMMPEETKVWGFTVPVSSAGRRKWPEARRDQVVEKINNGAGIRETAEEIGANKSLVALWVKKAEHLMRLVSAMIGPS